MLYSIAAVAILVLFALILWPKKQANQNQPIERQSLTPFSFVPPETLRPSASQWSKQIASDMLDEIAIADERARVLATMRRALDWQAANQQPAVRPAPPPQASPTETVI